MNSRVITISRESGSGGGHAGRKAAAKLGIPCYGAELIDKLKEITGLPREYIAGRSECAVYGSWLSSAFSDRDYSGHSVQDDLWCAQRQVLIELAGKGPCVIVGRCADYILRETADCLNIFICSDIKKRAGRIAGPSGMQKDSAEKRLREQDKRRAAYYRFYTGMKWGVFQNYHAVLNSGILGIDACAEMIARLYDKKFCEI